MQVHINDRTVEVQVADGLVVADLVEALAVHIDPGEIVTEVELDGGRFPAGDAALSSEPLHEGARLRITTASGRAVGEHLRQDVSAALQIVTAKCERVADLLDEGAAGPAYRLLEELLEELRLTILLDAQSAELAAVSPASSARSLEGVAAAMVEAQQAGDRQALAGLLRQDMAPLLRRWCGFVEAAG